MVAVVGVDAELVDDFEGVLAPIFDVDEGVVEWRAVVAGETVDLTEFGCSREDIWSDDLIEQATELAISELDSVEFLEFLSKVLFKCFPVSYVRAVVILQAAELANELIFKLSFEGSHGCLGIEWIGPLRLAFVSCYAYFCPATVWARLEYRSERYSPFESILKCGIKMDQLRADWAASLSPDWIMPWLI